MSLVILIMAGGNGKRMNSKIPKVLHEINSKPMIIHIIETALQLNPTKIGIIVGKDREIIIEKISENIDISNIDFINQEKALGTGHAIMSSLDFLKNYIDSKCLILSGDTPLISVKNLHNFINSTKYANILVCKRENPYGYGRILLENNSSNELIINRIIEEKDANKLQKKINLCNGGIYIFQTSLILTYINSINNTNAQNEYYLTDLIHILRKKKVIVNIYILKNKDIHELIGINTQEQLIELQKTVLN